MQPEQQQRIMGYFIEEAKDHLNTIEQGLLNLRGMMADPELVNEVFRAAHSVKGGAAMLGFHSIQRTSHRLEDYFKVLKEAPNIQPDHKLETLLLRVYDALKGYLEQLQTPAGLDEATAQASLTQLEPVFSEVEQHLVQLQQAVRSSSTFTQSPVGDPTLVVIFQNDVPAQLREMLQTFRQAETMLDARERLQGICEGLRGLGEAFGVTQWSQLIEMASRAIANPVNSYRDLAQVLIPEIKQAQELVLAGRAQEITASQKLQAMVPAPTSAAEMELDLADFFAIAEGGSSDDLDFSILEFAADDSAAEASDFDRLFDLDESDALSPDRLSLDGLFDLPDLEQAPGATDFLNQKGPDVGMEELNSLADLFEDELPGLEATWEQEEVLDIAALSDISSAELDAEVDDFTNFLSESSEERETQANAQIDDLADLFEDELLDGLDAPNLTSEAEIEELLDFSENLTEFEGSAAPLDKAVVVTETTASDLDFDELGLSQEAEDDSANQLDVESDNSLEDLSELFAGLDNSDLDFPSALNQANPSESIETLNSANLDRMFETSAPEDLSFDSFDLLGLDNDSAGSLGSELTEATQLNGLSELVPDPWDNLNLEAGANSVQFEGLFESTEMQPSVEGADLFNADGTENSGFAAQDLEQSGLDLDAQEDEILNSLFSGEITDDAPIENSTFDINESEISSTDFELDHLLDQPKAEAEATLNGWNEFDEEIELSLSEFSELGTDEENTLNGQGAINSESLGSLEDEDSFADLLNFSTPESLLDTEANSGNGASLNLEDSLADLLDFSESSTDLSIEEASLEESLNFDALMGAESISDSSLSLEDPIADLLDFSESSTDLSIEEASLEESLNFDALMGAESISDSSLSLEDPIADLLDFSAEPSTDLSIEEASLEESLNFDALMGAESTSDSSLSLEDPIADLLDFSESSTGLSIEEASLEESLSFDALMGAESISDSSLSLEDPIADLLDFSAEPSTDLSIEEPLLESFNLDDFAEVESLGEPDLLEQELGVLQNNLLSAPDVEPQLSGLEPNSELTEDTSLILDDLSNLDFDQLGAEPLTEETLDIDQSGFFDEVNLDLVDLGDENRDFANSSDTSLDELDSLLAEVELPSEPTSDTNPLLDAGLGAATIAGLGAGFAALQFDPTTAEADSLDDLLNLPASELDETSGNLDELESLLEEATPTSAAIDQFDDLESLLGDASDPASLNFAAAHEAEAEFGDLEKMLEEADMTMGGSAASRTATPPGRRSTRVARGFNEQTMRVPIKQLDNLSNLVGELVVNRNSLEQDQERLRQSLDNLLYQVQQLSDVGQRMQDLYERSLLESSLLASRQNRRVAFGGSDRSANGNSLGVEYDPLEMDRFTGFHSLSQEMIELIVRVRESSSDIEFIVDEADQVTRMFRQVTTQLQEGLTRSRMVPFAQTADRLPRAVRDIAMKCGKQAELVIEGRDTLIDKMILEHLYDPMTHLVNNAITHGIENPEVRYTTGKAPTGRITIRAFHQGNQTVISVSDDGAGIDVERVRSKAIEKGLITAAEAKNATRLDIYDLLFHPGFSTKDQADDFSGRGVGMDVVRTSLSEIRGTISIDSAHNKGTTFTIRLPLTLSISKALCCISDRARIAFPMDGVEDMLDLPKERLHTDAEGQACITWRDTVLPVRPLRELLSYNRHLSRGTVYGGNQEDDLVSIVILRSAGNYLALQVDQVLGEQEIVIKQLEGPVPKPIGVAGATVLGDGRIMPIADVLELIDLSLGRIRRDAGPIWEQGTAQPVVETAAVKTEPMVLIVDDSITVRELLSMTFNKVGYRVEQARDGQEAWEKLRSGLPCDIVFCDIEMPRMDGLELLSRIQKDPNLSNLPIAMLTSRGADRHRQMAASLGASGYFTKPYLEEALLDAAQRMLKGEVLISANSPGNG
ncbi:response regulator [Cyanobacteria bacterium FACHB-DQ100]|nr:response regulator [Cyanobacteria bacterium FACHB-DQ100]